MESSAKQHWYQQAWEVIWKETLKYVWLPFLALLFTLLSQRARSMPTAIAHPAEYWLTTSTILFGSCAGILSVAKFAVWGNGRFRRWRHPPSLQVTASGGKRAAIEIEHRGEPAAWEVRMRILRTLDNSINPDPLLHLCFLRKDGNTFRSLLLREGQHANIVLARICYTAFPGRWDMGGWVEFYNADSHHGTRVDAPVLVEINITADPPMRDGVLVKRIEVSRQGAENQLDCIDAPI